MKIYEFNSQFPDERSCRLHFKRLREEKGVVCKKCYGQHHYWLAKKWQWQCKKCKFRTTLRSGTILQFSNLPLYKWYLSLAMLSATKKGVSAKELQRQLGHRRYRTVWMLMQKIRVAMCNADEPISIEQVVEHEEKQFGIRPCKQTNKTSQFKYAIMESRHGSIEVEKHLKGEPSDVDSGGNIEWICDQKSSRPGFSYYYNTFMGFLESQKHESQSFTWVDIINRNAKRSILGVYHKVSTRFLQNYLSEFCFRLNRRNFNELRFDSLLNSMTQTYGGTIATIQI